MSVQGMNIFITFSLIFLSISYGKNSGLITAAVIPAAQPIPTVTSAASNVSINVTWTFSTGVRFTNVIVTVKNLQAEQFAAIGLGKNSSSMGEAHVFVCKRLADNTIVVQRYINPGGHHTPEPAGSEQGGVFTPGTQQFMEGVVICQFSLSGFTPPTFGQLTDLQPLSQSGSYYPLFAAGNLDPTDNSLKYHGNDSRIILSTQVQLNQNEVILYKLTNSNNVDLVKNHVFNIGKNLAIKRD